MENIENGFWSIFGKLSQMLAVVTVGVAFGNYFGPYSYERNKGQMKDQIDSIENQIDSLNSTIDSDTINYKNWLANNTHPIKFDPQTNQLPLLTIINSTTGGCKILKDGECFGKEVNAVKNDVLTILMQYKNTGIFEAKDVLANMDYGTDSQGHITTIYGRIIVGNNIYLSDSVKIYSDNILEIRLQETAQRKDCLSHVKPFSVSSLLSDSGYDIGNLKPGDSEAIAIAAVSVN
ncbi:hypothetical protein [Mucilaginibacter ginsenosidivorax]|uniref:Uncharacterized protein n=1 Tax=Mucilaginibacter ginsenosidivorax TaxID=862126 RepID=A0A5B8W3D6_9SPHI|nr:hypothetical protein [Mucilaginibacter ginsenosidivorax]QEC77386.1 hypothetical protein FSB76_16050 [Mucilaginibacter ginsenosidivorax]